MTDVRRAGAVLGTAFHDDPLFSWAIPDEDRRARALPKLFAGSLRHCARHGGVIEIEDGAAVVCWTDPDHFTIGVADALRSGLAAAPLWLGLDAARRLQRHEEPVDRRMRPHIGPTDAYLMAVGTTPASRGTGLGRQCVAAVSDAAAAAGFRSVVLRTENPNNVALYQRLGYDLIDHWTVEVSNLEVWALRQPLR
ncbi:MAG: GNAT family N-acetyltransferase [Nitriliruptorales bacterium]|nr:GNAT family N-acetyltransferase [Nitriliruptorales bacterium]